MITLNPVQLARAAAAARAERPATAIVHDTPEARIVVFRIAPGQAVPPHTNTSRVMIQVLAGHGVLTGAEGDRPCSAGELALFDPGEVHAMRAEREELLLLATIAPRPSR